MGEQGDRRPQVRVGGQLDQRVGLGRALDQDGGGPGGVQGGAHRAGGAGAVVPHTQQERPGVVGLGPAGVVHALTSRHTR